MTTDIISRAQGCLAGQLAGDALGSMVEFKRADQVHALYPDGVVEMQDGGTWDTIAGQPTDDSEMAILLARVLLKDKKYSQTSAIKQYRIWLDSQPFDCGNTIYSALKGNINLESQANGALMRISPLGIWGSRHDLADVKDWAIQDALLTHPHTICQEVNALYASAISYAIRFNLTGLELFEQIDKWANEWQVQPAILDCIKHARLLPPECDAGSRGWVLIAFQNALYSLAHSTNIVEAIKHTIWRGGDTDTNAAICGALLGAVYGIDSIPKQWIFTLENCKPDSAISKVKNPRPESMWPNDFLQVARELVTISV